MNPETHENWKHRILETLFEALAQSDRLRDSLVFKGARILSLHLGGGRQSYDLDSNLLPFVLTSLPDHHHQREFLDRELQLAIRRFFERMNPVRYQLQDLKVKLPKPHPMGWDAFQVRLRVDDSSLSSRHLPALEIDIAAPEELLDSSIITLPVGLRTVKAYSLSRIAGEKLRAFLSSLPAYRLKMRKPGKSVRAKDL